ncbi:MAG TPA: hypothetical protein VLI69_03755 [Gammaproteobacteria bacterium]|nr:hypothetical protein [Gammaproteobacteria bacterium]
MHSSNKQNFEQPSESDIKSAIKRATGNIRGDFISNKSQDYLTVSPSLDKSNVIRSIILEKYFFSGSYSDIIGTPFEDHYSPSNIDQFQKDMTVAIYEMIEKEIKEIKKITFTPQQIEEALYEAVNIHRAIRNSLSQTIKHTDFIQHREQNELTKIILGRYQTIMEHYYKGIQPIDLFIFVYNVVVDYQNTFQKQFTPQQIEDAIHTAAALHNDKKFDSRLESKIHWNESDIKFAIKRAVERIRGDFSIRSGTTFSVPESYDSSDLVTSIILKNYIQVMESPFENNRTPENIDRFREEIVNKLYALIDEGVGEKRGQITPPAPEEIEKTLYKASNIYRGIQSSVDQLNETEKAEDCESKTRGESVLTSIIFKHYEEIMIKGMAGFSQGTKKIADIYNGFYTVVINHQNSSPKKFCRGEIERAIQNAATQYYNDPLKPLRRPARLLTIIEVLMEKKDQVNIPKKLEEVDKILTNLMKRASSMTKVELEELEILLSKFRKLQSNNRNESEIVPRIYQAVQNSVDKLKKAEEAKDYEPNELTEVILNYYEQIMINGMAELSQGLKKITDIYNAFYTVVTTYQNATQKQFTPEQIERAIHSGAARYYNDPLKPLRRPARLLEITEALIAKIMRKEIVAFPKFKEIDAILKNIKPAKEEVDNFERLQLKLRELKKRFSDFVASEAGLEVDDTPRQLDLPPPYQMDPPPFDEAKQSSQANLHSEACVIHAEVKKEVNQPSPVETSDPQSTSPTPQQILAESAKQQFVENNRARLLAGESDPEYFGYSLKEILDIGVAVKNQNDKFYGIKLTLIDLKWIDENGELGKNAPFVVQELFREFDKAKQPAQGKPVLFSSHSEECVIHEEVKKPGLVETSGAYVGSSNFFSQPSRTPQQVLAESAKQQFVENNRARLLATESDPEYFKYSLKDILDIGVAIKDKNDKYYGIKLTLIDLKWIDENGALGKDAPLVVQEMLNKEKASLASGADASNFQPCVLGFNRGT